MKTTVKADELRTLNSKENLFDLDFHTIQQFHTKKDSEDNKRSLWIGLFDAKSILPIPTKGNVRDYMKKGKDGSNKVSSGNHAQIYDTLLNRIEDFHFLNGGITITSDSIFSRDNNRKKITLLNPQIINGAQTKGVLETFLKEYKDAQVLVKVELILSAAISKQEFFDDISIARNQQTAVKPISIAGKKKLLNELDKVTDVSLKINESQKDRFDTEKLIQLIFAVMPEDILAKAFPKRKELRDRSFIYSSKATIFKKFVEIAESEKVSNNSIVYDFIHEIANEVLNLYNDLRVNKHVITKQLDSLSDFKGKGYNKSISSNGDRKLTILDGVIFPILACLSILVNRESGKFSISEVNKDVIQQITKNIVVYSNLREHNNAQILGKSATSYITPYDMFIMQRSAQLTNL